MSPPGTHVTPTPTPIPTPAALQDKLEDVKAIVRENIRRKLEHQEEMEEMTQGGNLVVPTVFNIHRQKETRFQCPCKWPKPLHSLLVCLVLVIIIETCLLLVLQRPSSCP